MTIRGILFDAGGVLYCRPQPTRKYVANLLAEKGHATQLSAELERNRRILRSRADRGLLRTEEYWDQVLLMSGVADARERLVLAGRIDAYSDQILRIAGARDALAGLKRRGFLLGIVTDTIYPVDRKMHWLEQAGVADLVDVVACSSVVGVHKPDPGIYLDALQQAGLAPAEAAFVGHAADELRGARQVGLATVAVYNEPGVEADHYATSLLDLLSLPIFRNKQT